MRPIAAFSMSDYEQLTRQPHQVAEFRRGKDKQKRKRRGLGMAAAIGGGIAGAGVLAAGARYGGAALGYRKAQKNFDAKTVLKGGAKGQLSRDVNAVKSGASNAFNKVKNYDYKGLPGRLGSKAQSAGLGAMNIGKGLASAAASRPLTSAALGLGAAAALGGAAYGAKKLMDRKKKKK